VDYATLTALITGLHRASQLNLPITVAGPGFLHWLRSPVT